MCCFFFQYKQNLDRANSQLNAQRTENQQLQRNLQGARNQESSEIINALKAQIRICTEDFESERADRQRAHEKLNRQKQETERLRKEVGFCVCFILKEWKKTLLY
jgi:seryl-tRNA synthetase